MARVSSLDLLSQDKWREWAAVYYGESVEGYGSYVEDILARVAHVRAKAAKAGIAW